MALKERKIVSATVSRSCERTSTMTWDFVHADGCPDANAPDVNVSTSFYCLPVPRTYDSCIQRAEKINYGCSRPWFFSNHCGHTLRYRDPEFYESLVHLERSISISSEQGNTHCLPACYTSINHTETLKVPIEAAILPAVNPMVSAGNDTFLSQLGLEGYFSKMAEIDRDAMRDMVPRLDDGFNLPLFLWELRDVPRMVGYLVSMVAHFPTRLLKLWKRPLNQMSEHWLSAIFGWMPFVRDVQTLAHKFYYVRKAVAEYINDAGKLKTYHWRRGANPFDWIPEDSPFWHPTGESIRIDDYWYQLNHRDMFEYMIVGYERSRSISHLRKQATMLFSYNVPSINSTLLSVLAGLDYFGVNLSIAKLWQAIPFSFVVDWVVGVGSYLRSFDLQNVPAEVYIYDFCRSIRYDYSDSMFNGRLVEIHTQGESIEQDRMWRLTPLTRLPRVRGKGYYRIAGDPDLSEYREGISFRSPKGLQLISAAALGASRRRIRRGGGH